MHLPVLALAACATLTSARPMRSNIDALNLIQADVQLMTVPAPVTALDSGSSDAVITNVATVFLAPHAEERLRSSPLAKLCDLPHAATIFKSVCNKPTKPAATNSSARTQIADYLWALTQGVISWAIWVVLCLMVWCYSYSGNIECFDNNAVNDPVETFTHSHFGCFNNTKVCLCACLCPALRWADTVNMGGFLGVSTAMALFFGSVLLNIFVYMPTVFGFFSCALILFYRHKLRAKLDLPSWTLRSCCIDFFYVFCCTCCAVAQEARVVRSAYQNGMTLLAGINDEPLPAVKKEEPLPSVGRDIFGALPSVNRNVFASLPSVARGSSMPTTQTSYAYRSEVPGHRMLPRSRVLVDRSMLPPPTLAANQRPQPFYSAPTLPPSQLAVSAQGMPEGPRVIVPSLTPEGPRVFAPYMPEGQFTSESGA